MKRLIILSCLALMVGSSSFAQKTAIKMNLFSPIFKTYNFQVEHAIGEKKSLQLGFFYTGYKVDESGFSGFGITPEMRFYLSQHDAPKGWFIAPYLRYFNFSLKETFDTEEAEATLSSFGGGVVLGGQAILGNHFTLESFIGPCYNAASIKAKTEGYESDSFSAGPFDGFGVRFGVCIGFAF